MYCDAGNCLHLRISFTTFARCAFCTLMAMNEEETLLSGVEYKVRKLIREYHEIKEENSALKKEKDQLTEQLATKNEVIKTLEDKLKTVKLAKTLGSGTGNEQAKMKIDELVREIDKCIGLLNA